MVVRVGTVNCPMATPSNPTTAKSSGTVSPRTRAACRAPTAIWSLYMKAAVGRSGPRSSSCPMARLAPAMVFSAGQDEGRIEGDTGLGERAAIAIDTIPPGSRLVQALGDVGDAAVTEVDQMPGRHVAPRLEVDAHAADSRVGAALLEHHDRHAAGRELRQFGGGAVLAAGDDDAVEGSALQERQGMEFPRRLFAGMTETA